MSDTADALDTTFTVNGTTRTVTCEPRKLLSDVLRDDLGLTGTHVGCEHGACGACTVLVGGEAVRACLLFAVQMDGEAITTIEGIAPEPGALSPVQQAMRDQHGLQCGFCTPGVVVSLTAFLRDFPEPSDDEIRDALSGTLCRCTGYQGIVNAARQVRAGTSVATS
jgi:aerobic carbon-monoxide dehydrogenase small subunit